MPTQSNKQTQNVKVVVNNKVGCCPDKPKPRRRKPTPKPPPEPEMPVPVQPVWAKGLSAQAVRPMVYAPSTTIIQPDNVAGNLPAYFESRFTNQQASLEQMRNSIREQFQEVQNELAQQAINNAELQRIARAVAQAEQRTMTTLPSSSSSSVQGASPPETPMTSLSPQSSIQATTLHNNPLYDDVEPVPLRPLVIPPASPPAPAPQNEILRPLVIPPASPPAPAPQNEILRPLVIPPASPPAPEMRNPVADGIAPQVNLFEALGQQNEPVQNQPAAAMNLIQQLDRERLQARANNNRREEMRLASQIRRITEEFNVPSHHHISGLTNLFAQQYGL